MAEPNKPDDINGLIQVLEQNVAVAKLQERFEQQTKEHKQYLESLMDRTVKVLYAIAAIVAGGAAFFGIKTFWDIDDRLKSLAKEEVAKYIDKEFIVGERDREIAAYKNGTVISYYALSSLREETADKRLPEQDAAVVLSTLSDPKSPFFLDAVRIARSLITFRNENAGKIGPTLMDVLNNQWSGKASILSVDQQIEIIEALASAKYQAALAPFLKAIDDHDLPGRVRISLVRSLSSLTPKEKQREVGQLLAKGITEIRQNYPDLYEAKTCAAFVFTPDLIMTEIQSLAKSSVSEDLLMFARVLKEALLPKQFDSDETALLDQVESAISSFLANPTIDRISVEGKGVVPGRRGLRPSMADLTIWVKTSKDTWDGISLTADEAMNGTLVDAVIRGIPQASPDIAVTYIIRLIKPLIAFGTERFEYEKIVGTIARNADPVLWQDGFTARSTDASLADKELLLLGSSAEKVTVLRIDSESSADIRATTKMEVAWKSLDFSSFKWRQARYGSGPDEGI